MSRYEIKFSKPKIQIDNETELQIWVDGKLIDVYSDDGEPEDNFFCRDWSWIKSELEKAYELGFEHGQQHEFENSSRGF